MRSRYVPQQIMAKLHAENVGQIVELYEIDLPSGTVYWSDVDYTWRGQAYAAIVKERSEIVSSLNCEDDETSLTVINIDGTIRALIAANAFEAARFRYRLAIDGLGSSTTPALTGGGTGSLTVSTVTPKQLDGLWTFTKRNGLTTWDVTVTYSADGLVKAQTNTATTGVAYTSDDGYLACTINAGTYPDGSVWKFRTVNNFLYWCGVTRSPEDVSERLAVIPVEGLAEILRVDTPKRQFQATCPWIFGTVAAALGRTTPCGYTGPTTTANGAGVSSTTLTPTSMTNFANSKGRSIKIGSGSEVNITAVGSTTVTLESARSWSNGDNIVFQSCRKTFADCQDADREFEYGGFRAISTVKSVVQHGTERGKAISVLGGFSGEATKRQRNFSQQLVAFPVPFTEDPVPILYGRRNIPGIPIEFVTFEDSGGKRWRAAFYCMTAGLLENTFGDSGPADKAWVGGKERKHRVRGTSPNEYLVNGFFERLGGPGVNDTETESEYGTDSDALTRTQNIDFRTTTGNTYPGIAYIIFIAPQEADLWEQEAIIPDATIRAHGRIYQKYLATGAADGAKAFGTNPIWAYQDLVLDILNGPGILSADLHLSRNKESADYCDPYIASVEADAKVTSGATSATQTVASTAGFRRFQKVYKNGVDTGQKVSDITSATVIVLDGSITTATGDRLQQYNPRFECDLHIGERSTAFELAPNFFNGCRGRMLQVDGKLAFEIDRATYAQLNTADPGLEIWTSASNLTNYTETTTGGSTIAQELTIKYAGTYSAKLTKQGGGYASLLGGWTLERGKRYTVSFRVRPSAANTSVGIEVYNATDALQLQADYTWGASVVVFPVLLIDTTAFELVSFTFTVDPHSSSATPMVNVALRTHTDLANGDSLYLDEWYVDGPLGGEFFDLGQSPLAQRCMIVEGESAFEQVPNDQAAVNEIKVTCSTEFQGETTDQTIQLVDDNHQATHLRKEFSISCPSLASADQAVRIAKYHLARCRTLQEGASSLLFLAGLALAPADVVRLTHRSPGWTQRLCQLLRTRLTPDMHLQIEAEHYSAAVYTDIGEPSEPGIGAGVPTITLTLDAVKRRKLELSWVLSAAGVPVRFYEVYVGLATISATDPDIEYLEKTKWKRRQYTYRVKHADKGSIHYARVVAVLSDGREAISNEVSGTDSTTLDDENDGSTRTLVREVPNMILDGDFSRDTKWTKNAHGSTVCQINADRAELNATSHSGSLLPTIFRNIPKDSPPANKRLAPLNSWMTWAMSAKYPGSAANADLLFIFFTGAEIGDGSESNYKLIYGFPSGSMTTSWQRASDSFQWGVSEPALPGGGNNNRAGVRTASTNTVYADKIALYHGLIDKDGLIFAQTSEDENAGFYPDFSDNAIGGGGANSGGGLGNCVLAGEPVWLNGSIRPIGAAKAGDRIVAWRGGTLAATVLGVRRALVRDLVEVVFVNDTSQICTARHRFAREPENGEQEDALIWTAAEDLESGARLLRASPLVTTGRLKPVRVREVRRLTAEHEVVNVQVAGTHNYLLVRHDLLCHNVKMVGD